MAWSGGSSLNHKPADLAQFTIRGWDKVVLIILILRSLPLNQLWQIKLILAGGDVGEKLMDDARSVRRRETKKRKSFLIKWHFSPLNTNYFGVHVCVNVKRMSFKWNEIDKVSESLADCLCVCVGVCKINPISHILSALSSRSIWQMSHHLCLFVHL